jgi:Protein of unknown function (DUF2975)
MIIKGKNDGKWEIRIFNIAFWLVALANLAYYGHSLVRMPGVVKMVTGPDPFAAYIISARLSWFLVIGILIWLLTHIYQLIRSISKKGPFDAGNPRRVRKVAYGALMLALVVLLSEISNYLLMPAATLKMLLYNLMGVPMWAATFGLALLVVARVFEEGLRLKENENLTI